jgi:hypothetical protein
VVVVVGNTPDAEPEAVVDDPLVAGRPPGRADRVQGDRLVAILGGTSTRCARPLLVAQFGPGPVVVGLAVADLLAAGESAAAAVAGLMAAPAWPDAAPGAGRRPPRAALAGDDLARERLVQEIPPLQSTDRAGGDPVGVPGADRRWRPPPGSCSSTLQRYGLRRVTEVCGYALADPRQALTLRMALALGRLADARWPRPAYCRNPTKSGP